MLKEIFQDFQKKHLVDVTRNFYVLIDLLLKVEGLPWIGRPF